MPKDSANEQRPENNTPELSALLRHLVESEQIEGTAKGITRLVISRGEKTLSERQEWVFNTHVRAKYVDLACRLCEDLIPLSEVMGSWSNGGLCAPCARILGKDDEGAK